MCVGEGGGSGSRSLRDGAKAGAGAGQAGAGAGQGEWRVGEEVLAALRRALPKGWRVRRRAAEESGGADLLCAGSAGAGRKAAARGERLSSEIAWRVDREEMEA